MPEERSQVASTPASPPNELRLGLAMNGGIALVLYQAGVSHEVLRFIRGEGAYGAALKATGVQPVLDVITGASAGGIACVMLGSCIATGEDFDAFHEVWIKDADIYGMRYPGGVTPKSLLDTKQLIGKVQSIFEDQALTALKRGVKQAPPDLFVRLARTDFYGTCLNTRDALGHSIDVQTQSSVVALDGPSFQTWDSTGVAASRIETLVSVAQETSAFPGAWPAVQDDRTRRWYIDGGLWNNQPLDLAVEAVKDKPAFFRTHRSLLLVQPDPLIVDPQTALPEPAVGQVVASVPLMGLNGNLWPAIQGILNNNQRADLYAALVGALAGGGGSGIDCLEKLGCAQRDLSDQQLAPYPELDPGGDSEGSPIPLPENSTTLLNRIRIQDLLFDNDPWLIQRWQSALDALDRKSPDTAALARGAALAALKSLGNYDLRMRAARRLLEELNAELNAARESSPAPSQDVAGQKLRLYTQIETISDYLYLPLEETANIGPDDSAYHPELRRHSRYRRASVEMLQCAEKALEGFSAVDRAELPSDHAAAIAGCLAAWVAAVRSEAASKLTLVAPLDVDTAQLTVATTLAVRAFMSVVPAIGVAASETIERTADVVRDAAAHIHNQEWPEITCLDYVRHVMAAVADLTGKKQIDLVRVSPNDTDNLGLIGRMRPGPKDPPASKVKLAGEGLGHFQGFLEERWRRNDYAWARLDTAEILLRTLQRTANAPGNAGWSESDYERTLALVQAEILQDEARLFNKHKPAETPALPAGLGPTTWKQNRDLIGFGAETVADASEPRFSENLNYLANTLLKLLRGNAEKPPAALSMVERGLRVTSYVAQALMILLPRGKAATARSFVPLVVFVLLVAAVGFGAGWLSGSSHWSAFVEGSLATLVLLTVGCLIGWRPMVAVPLAIGASLSLYAVAGGNTALERVLGGSPAVRPYAVWLPLAAAIAVIAAWKAVMAVWSWITTPKPAK